MDIGVPTPRVKGTANRRIDRTQMHRFAVAWHRTQQFAVERAIQHQNDAG